MWKKIRDHTTAAPLSIMWALDFQIFLDIFIALVSFSLKIVELILSNDDVSMDLPKVRTTQYAFCPYILSKVVPNSWKNIEKAPHVRRAQRLYKIILAIGRIKSKNFPNAFGFSNVFILNWTLPGSLAPWFFSSLVFQLLLKMLTKSFNLNP